MAGRSRSNLLSPILLLLFLILAASAVLSGRWGFVWASTIAANGSQQFAHVRYGVARWILAERDSDLNGHKPGVGIEDMKSFRFEWGVHMTLKGSTRIVQIPLWFPSLLMLAWLVLRTAGRQLRKAAGKCPVCGRLLDHERICAKCSQLAPDRPLR